MRRVLFPLYISILIITSLATLNIYLLSAGLDFDSTDTVSRDLQHVVDVGDDMDSGGEELDSEVPDPSGGRIQLTRMAKPFLKISSKEAALASKDKVQVKKSINQAAKGETKQSQPIPVLPPIYASCETFYEHYFSPTYNPNHLGGITQKYKVSLCTKVKNEAQYVEEWILYNWLFLRVSHFYIYDDSSEDNLKAILQPYIEKGLIFWNKNQTVDEKLLAAEPRFTKDQRFSVADCTTKYKVDSEWLGFWDIDEFAYLPEVYFDRGEIDTYVEEREWDNILIPWAVFGSSNHSTVPPGPVINNYRWRFPLLQFGVYKAEGKYYGKVLYKTNCIPLAAVHLEDMTSKACVKGGFPIKFDSDVEGYPIHMKHYWSKSFEDYKSKLGKWQNAVWLRDELFELTLEKFDELMRDEKLHLKYDVDMLQYVDELNFALDCVEKLRKR